MMTNSRQRRSPKNKEQQLNCNSGSGGSGGSSGLAVQDGSHDSSLLGSSTSPPGSPPRSPARHAATRLRQQRRRLLQNMKRLRITGLFVSTGTLFMALCLFAVLQRTQQGHQHHATTTARSLEENPHDFQLSTPAAPACSNQQLSPHEISYTLVTQCSSDRLWMMEHHCARWGGGNTNEKNAAISIAVWTNETVAHTQQVLYKLGCSPDQLTVQTVHPNNNTNNHNRHGHSAAIDYPVNILRNLGLAAVQTTHVAYVDVDFWESTDLYETLSSQVVTEHLATADYKAALVLPAWQLSRQCAAWTECPDLTVPLMPQHRDQLLQLAKDGKVTPFDPANKGGHGSTRYKEWLSQDAESLLEIDCVFSNRYEPYLVVRYCQELPPFQAAFSGYGKNKMTWVMQLRRMGYTFHQVGEAFVVHYPHLDSAARLAWNGGVNGQQLRKPENYRQLQDYKRARNDQTFYEFREWLAEKIPADMMRVPKCDRAMDDDAKLWIARPGVPVAAGEDGDDDYVAEGDDAVEYDDPESNGPVEDTDISSQGSEDGAASET